MKDSILGKNHINACCVAKKSCPLRFLKATKTVVRSFFPELQKTHCILQLRKKASRKRSGQLFFAIDLTVDLTEKFRCDGCDRVLQYFSTLCACHSVEIFKFPPTIFCKNSVKLTFSLKSYTVNQFDGKFLQWGKISEISTLSCHAFFFVKSIQSKVILVSRIFFPKKGGWQ